MCVRAVYLWIYKGKEKIWDLTLLGERGLQVTILTQQELIHG